MKKLLAIALTITMLFSLSVTAFAEGDGNADGGGGGMGDGSSTNSWNPGMDGVRVSVVEAETGENVGTVIDYTNKSPSLAYYFGRKTKLQYRDGTSLSPVTSTYSYKNPSPALPKVVSSGGSSNIEAVKRYFCTDGAARMVANDFGIDFDALVSGRYKLFLEPIAYFKFEGNQVGMTATEAALYDRQLNGVLRNRMATLSHQNLPLAIFLERPDLGFPAYSGGTSSKQSNDTIISSLGMGIVSYKDLPETPPEVATYDYEYRVNTEVITSVKVSGGQSDPDNPTTVRFNIKGTTYTVSNVFYPDGDSQLAWVRWRTPSTPQEFTIPVTVSGTGSAQGTIRVKIVDLDKNPPPNPVADDRNDSFTNGSLPSKEQKTSQSWGVWSTWWQEYWVWILDWDWCGHGDEGGHWVDNGWWEDQGWWMFDYNGYSASLNATMSINPDGKNPTANGSNMKSGYGINISVSTAVNTNQSSAVTPPQNAVSYFPEFRYETYWRLLDRVQSGYGARFEFKKNKYSTYSRRTHFSPIWMPDGSYTVYTWQMDSWTPAGMLSANLSDSVTVRDNLWSDWHSAIRFLTNIIL